MAHHLGLFLAARALLLIIVLTTAGCVSGSEATSASEPTSRQVIANSPASTPAPSATALAQSPVAQNPDDLASEPADCRDLDVDEHLQGTFDAPVDEITVGRDRDGNWVIALCAPQESSLTFGGNKPLRTFVVDVDGDGFDELIVGAPTGASPFTGTGVRVQGGQLIESGDAVRILVADQDRDGESFGCVDLDDDGDRELVSIRYRFDGPTLAESSVFTWWRWPADSEFTPDAHTGTLDVSAEAAAVHASINGTCGSDVLIRVDG